MKWISAAAPPVKSESYLAVIMYRPTGFVVGSHTYPAYPGYFSTINNEWYLLWDTEGTAPVEGVTHYQHLASLLWHNEEWEPIG